MQNKQKIKRYETLLPPVPESYRLRMEDALAALPVEKTRTVSVGRFTKKQPIILIAALITLLTVGTAMAVAISRMGEVRDGAQTTLAYYQAVVNGDGTAESLLDSAVPTPYVIMAEFETDDNGEWRPGRIDRIDVSDTIGPFTIRLKTLFPNYGSGRLMADIWIEADHAQPYTLEDLRISVNGGDPIPTIDHRSGQQWSATPTPYAAEEWFSDTFDILDPIFELSGNPLSPGTTFEITGTLNGEPFSLFYDFSREAYEAMKAEQLNELDAIGQLLSGVPDDAIPVNASIRGFVIEEIALKDHFLYVVEHYDTEYCSNPDNPRDAAYDEYDSGIDMAVDGMLSTIEFVSAVDDENGVNHGLYYAYYPYDDPIPNESLISYQRTVFRVNWETRTVTAPKDEAEYLAWRKESMELSAKDYNNDYLAKPEQACGAFTVKEMIYMNKSAEGQLGLILETDEPVKDAQHGADKQPVVTVNGTALVNESCYVQTPNDFYGGSKDGGKLNGFWLYCPAYRTLPDTFDVAVSWRGDTVTFTMHKSDFEAAYVDVPAYKSLLGF